MEENILCPITWEKATTSITIYKWNFYIILFEVKKIKISVSELWKKMHHQSLWSCWEFFNVFWWDILMNIPFLWWILLLFASIYLWVLLIPLWIIFDIFLKKKIFWKWLIKLNSKWEIYKV